MMRAAVLLSVAMLLSACAAQREASERNARLVELHTQLGAGYMQRGQLDVATQELEYALALDSDDVQANNMMALLQARLKDPVKAQKYFERAIAAAPLNSDAQNNYGAFLCDIGKYDEAVKRFENALKDPLYRTPELANLNAGLCLMKKPAPRAAEEYFRAALKAQPRLAPALLQMARIAFDSGQNLAARGYMQRYLEVAQDTPEVLLLAIQIERALNTNKDLLASYALRLTGKFPDSAEAKQIKSRRTGNKK